MLNLAILIVLVVLIAISVYWVLGNVLSLSGKPAVYFPLLLAAKMGVASIVGRALGGVGGIVLAVYLYNNAFSKRADYRRYRTLVSGLILSLLSSAIILYTGVLLAFEVLD